MKQAVITSVLSLPLLASTMAMMVREVSAFGPIFQTRQPFRHQLTQPTAAALRTHNAFVEADTQAAAAASPTTRPAQAQVVQELDSTEDFLKFIDEPSSDQLCVVKYYANYCKVCQRTKMVLRRIATNEKGNDRLKFATFEIAAAGGAAAFKSLGVTRTPFIQIYRNGLCVASFATGPSHNFATKTEGTIKLCLDRSEKDWEQFQHEFQDQINETKNAIFAMRTRVLP